MPIHVSARQGWPGAVNPPATGTGGIYYGLSDGANVVTSINTVKAHMVRTYNRTLASSWDNTETAHNVPAGIPQLFSMKIPTADWCDSTSAGYNASMQTVQDVWGGLPQISGKPQRVAIHHEPFGDGDITAAQWAQGQVNLAVDALVDVNANRTSKIILVGIMQGFPQARAAFGSYYTTASVKAIHDAGIVYEIGVDCYGFNFAAQQPPTNDQPQKAHDYAKGRGLPWCIPEFGYRVDQDSTDDEMLSAMQSLASHVKNDWPAAEQPTNVLWFNGGHNQLTGTNNTKSINYLTGLCAGGA